MKDKELSRMSRSELIEIIYEMKKRELALTERLSEAEARLADREIRMSKAGSIAKAALELSDVFTAAQDAADTYLRSIKSAYESSQVMLAEIKQKHEREVGSSAKKGSDAASKPKSDGGEG